MGFISALAAAARWLKGMFNRLLELGDARRKVRIEYALIEQDYI